MRAIVRTGATGPTSRTSPIGLRLIVAVVVSSALAIAAQSVTIATVGDNLHVKAPAFSFIKGEPLNRLKDGRSVRFEFSLAVLVRPTDGTLTETQQSFVLSYDLWEERFAITQLGANSRSVSHLTASDAEAWCLEHLLVPLNSIARVTRDQFWIRLSYRVQSDAEQSADDAAFTLRGLIDRLSRRRQADELRDSVDAGPFRLRN